VVGIYSGDSNHELAPESRKRRFATKANPSFTGNPRTGGSVFEIWTFTGIKNGEYKLLFYYKRFGRIIQKKELLTIIIQ
jgi:hypothetical protein